MVPNDRRFSASGSMGKLITLLISNKITNLNLSCFSGAARYLRERKDGKEDQ